MLRLLYNLILSVSLPFLGLRLLLKSYQYPAYREKFTERLGFFTSPAMPSCLWIHAVSVGESMAAAPLIEKLAQHHPNQLILLTTTTPTAYQWAKTNLPPSITHAYLPYDYPIFIKRFVEHFRPKIAIIMETELWPNLLYYLQKKSIPAILANARLSKKSFQGYQRIKPLSRAMINTLDHVLAQSQDTIDHFQQLGLCPSKLTLSKSLKFTPKIPDMNPTIQQKLQKTIHDKPCWLAASIHPGEEETMIAAHQAILQTRPTAKMIIAPRHPEQMQYLIDAINTSQMRHTLLSDRFSSQTYDVLVIDSIGHLMQCFAFAQAAFVGGSLVPLGGHNLIEPLLFHVPVATGPSMYNFQDIWESCCSLELCQTIKDQQELTSFLITNLNQTSEAFKRHCQAFIQQQNHGLDQHLDKLNSLIRQ